MKEKIELIILKNKNDKSNYKEYIKSFCNSEKAKEIYSDNSDFKDLENYVKDEPKEEEY